MTTEVAGRSLLVELELPPLETLKPHLSDEAFGAFCNLAVRYAAEIPGVSGRTLRFSHEELMSPQTPEESEDSGAGDNLSFSKLSGTYQQLVGNADRNLAETLVNRDKLEVDLSERIRDEFKACGITDEDDPLLIEALEAFQEASGGVFGDIEAKGARYSVLMELFIGNGDAIGGELAQRMKENLEEASQIILGSFVMPSAPSRLSFGLKKEGYAHAVKEKEHLVRNRIKLASRDEILADFVRSADAAYRRILYGQREMILDRGFASDSNEEIDSYQQRHFDQQNGRYYIALTPQEYAYNQLESWTKTMLYGADSMVSQRLNERSGNAHGYGFYTRSQRQANFQRQQKFSGGAGKSQGGDNEPRKVFSEQRNEDPVEGFGQEQNEVYAEIMLLIDATRQLKLRPEIRDKVLEVAADIIKDVNYRGTEKVADKALSTLRQMFVTTHPDRIGSTDKELVEANKYISDLFDQCKKTEK